MRAGMKRFGGAAWCVAAMAGAAAGITIRLDYSYDANNFFGTGNPSGAAAGAAAKEALEAAAGYLSDVLQDTFDEVSTPAPFASSVFNGVATWQWQATFDNPATGGTVTLTDPTIPADEYVIYAGGRSIAGSTLGIGGPGGFGWSSGGNGGGFTSGEIDQINAITDAFSANVETRGEAAGEFAAWGGSITFDNDAGTSWHYDHTTAPSGSQNDFYSVALHELTHALGFGTSNEWISLASGGTFFGSAAYAAYGNAYPPTSGGHWNYNTQSTVYGTTTAQEAAMDPDILTGTRKYFTTLDAAALADIGWEVQAPQPPAVPGDFDDDDDVDGADFLIWQRSSTLGPNDLADWRTGYGTTPTTAVGVATPEPSAWLLGAGALAGLGFLQGRFKLAA